MTLDSIILNLWQVSRTALADSPYVPTRYERMIYVRDGLNKWHKEYITGLSAKKVWFAIEDAIN